MPIMPPWANDHDAAHLQAKTVPMKLIGSKSAQWLCVQASVRFLDPYHTHGHAHYAPPLQQMTMALHIYRPRQFQWTRFGVSQPCSCGVSVLARFQEPLTRPWACPLCPHGQIVRLFQRTWIRSEWAQWLLSSSIRKIPEALITDSRSLYYVLGHGHVAPMGKWPWHYSSRGWDNPNELDLEWISHVVAELWPAGWPETIP